MKADAIQAHADRKDTENFYSALKVVYGPTSSGSSAILSSGVILSTDGSTIISDKEKILERWAEHFNSVLNRPSAINGEAIARLPLVPVDETLANPPTEASVVQYTQTESNGMDWHSIGTPLVNCILLGDLDYFRYGSV